MKVGCMDERLRKLAYVFKPRSVAIVGGSPIPNKIGNVLMKNFIDGRFVGKIYAVNPKYTEVLGAPCYPRVTDIPNPVDCVIIATPAETVPGIIEDCGKKGAKGAIVLSGGFEEVNRNDLADKMKALSDTYKLPVIGPNCLGVFNPYTRVDSIFLPMYKLERPGPGNIAFVTQSGAVGSTVVDLAAHYGMGISKFISYGNGTVLNECDMLEFLEKDGETSIIILYLEGVKDGRRLLKWLKKVNPKKPIVAMKAGKYGKAMAAARSHTGNLAGNYTAYKAAFRQAKVTEADDLQELFDFVKIFDQPLPRGNRVGVITNGGGMGVLTADAINEQDMEIAEFSEQSKEALKKILPSYGNVGNPLDLVADADVDAYEKAIDVMMNDPGIDSLAIVVLTQTPAIDERIIGVLTKACDERKKPLITISVGGNYTEAYKKALESKGVPSYGSPLAAIKALRRFTDYAVWKGKTGKT
jgi:acetyl coenzyme A synthetase (ADP forming)-like protein